MRFRKLGFLALSLLATAPLIADAQVRVRGYTRKDGTYVAPHLRSSPNRTQLDNWSTRGNVNPYTGEEGKKDPYAASQRQRSTSSSYPATASDERGPY